MNKLRLELYKQATDNYECIIDRPCYSKHVDPKITIILLDCLYKVLYLKMFSSYNLFYNFKFIELIQILILSLLKYG